MNIDDPTEPDSDAFDLMIGRAREEMAEKLRFNSRTYGLNSRWTWSMDLDGGVVRFGNDDGQVMAAPVQIIGMTDAEGRTWVWGCDNTSLPQHLCEHATMTKAFAAECGIDRLTTPVVHTTQDEAWDLLVLAVLLSGAQGGMRGERTGSTYFMTHGAPVSEEQR